MSRNYFMSLNFTNLILNDVDHSFSECKIELTDEKCPRPTERCLIFINDTLVNCQKGVYQGFSSFGAKLKVWTPLS